MNLNSDFGARAAVHAARLDWTPSPILGVVRRMLDLYPLSFAIRATSPTEREIPERDRFAGGGSWIRTIGSARDRLRFKALSLADLSSAN